jgi:hypothetical protein
LTQQKADLVSDAFHLFCELGFRAAQRIAGQQGPSEAYCHNPSSNYPIGFYF